MAIERTILKTKPYCKVTFTIPKEQGKDFKTAFLVGDFNLWNTKTHKMKKKRDNSFSIVLELERGREYQFRYLADEEVWLNDSEADKYVPSLYGDSENCVIEIE